MEVEVVDVEAELAGEDGAMGRKRRKTRRGKKKRSPRIGSFSRVTTSTPFVEIKSSDILYSRPKHEPFSPAHPLYVGPSGVSELKRIKELIAQILETRLHDRRKGVAAAPCSNSCRRRLAALLAQLLARRRRCRPSALLARHCGPGRVPPGVLASALRSLLRRLLPTDLLGPQRLDAPIRHFLDLGRYDVLCVGDVTRGLRLRGRAWLAGEPADAAVSLLGRVAVWALRCFVLDVIRAFFYVTELLQPRLQLGFFLLRHWHRDAENELARMTSSGALQPLPAGDTGGTRAGTDVSYGAKAGTGVGTGARAGVASGAMTVAGSRAEGVAGAGADVTGAAITVPGRLRFLPKPGGSLRPVCGLRPPPAVRDRWAQLRAVLRLPQLGRDTTAPDHRQLHARWLRFATARRRLPSPLWYVRADVRDAYGSVSHQLLLRLLRERLATLPAQVTLCRNRKPRGVGYTAWDGVSTGQRTVIHTAAVAEEISSLVTGQTMRYGRRQFRLARGLMQGGPLSADLCDLYYGAVLRRAVPWCFPERPQEALLLLRCVDDVLLLTERRPDAVRFLQRLRQGLDGRHAHLNEAKTRTNVEDVHGPEVAFFGSVFNVESLEVSPDCSTYQEMDMRFTFRTRQLRSPGRYLLNRLRYLAVVRLSAIHWDPRLNSAARLRRSLAAHLALTGRRYVALLSRLRLDRDERNAAFLARAAVICWRRVAAVLGRFARQGGYRPWARPWTVRRAGAEMFLRLLPPHLEQLRAAVRAEGRRRTWSS